jgi:hypothetical protein
MTWKEIQEKYPDRWVALTDVTYLNNDNCNVESAVLVCVMSDEEYVAKRLFFINEGKNYEYTRTTDMRGFMGVTI